MNIAGVGLKKLKIPFSTHLGICAVLKGLTGIFKNKFVAHGQYIRFATLLLISICKK